MFQRDSVHLGIAPINWTNDDLPDIGGHIPYEQCLSEMALAGYEGCEIGNKYPKDVPTLNQALDLRGLTICNSWFSCRFTTDAEQETVRAFDAYTDFLKAVGANVVGPAETGRTIHGDERVPLFANEPELSNQDFEKIANGLNQLGRIAKSKGMSMAYHYHAGTGIQSEDAIDKLMAMTDADVVSLLFDTGHATMGGINPLHILRKHGHRVRHVHLKDVRKSVLERMREDNLSFLQAVRAGVFTVPGDGNMVDMEAVLAELATQNYKGWLVVEAEQDSNIANPLEYAIKARKFINKVTGL